MFVILSLYWLAIFVLTHIPGKHITFFSTPFNISDKMLHFLAYFILSSLLWITLNPSTKVDWRKSRVWWIVLVIICYGFLDELLQAYTQRSCSLYDFIADFSGAIMALILLSIFPFSNVSKSENANCTHD
jgi:VanZ family protein